MDIETFCAEKIDGYLFGDLKVLKTCQADYVTGYGGCGYPQLMTVLAGIELLGRLASTKGGSYEETFNYCWENILVKTNRRYKDFGSFVYSMVRHGLMHSFSAKTGVFIGRATKDREHMSYSKTEKWIFIDPVMLAEDLEESYKNYVKPVVFSGSTLLGVNKVIMQNNLNKMITTYTKEAEDQFPNLNVTFTSSTILSSGASTTMPPPFTTISGTVSFPPKLT